ncbi:histidine kinase [Burkholderia sp. AU30280]|uniref:sensor histidine kinase n=1 Tax=Burkholderia sp. AU30280 TaxID=2879628 RepID=UPI001CF53026|nr:histidine kinase [Burkholderia sp. AU30280]MCA8277813.1 histidine kinase [Burkholderia sp. AU30280]
MPVDATTSSRRFWSLNALAWVAYGLFGLWAGSRFTDGEVVSGAVLISLSLAISLWLCSGALRSMALRQGWWNGSLGSLVLKLTAGVVVGTSVAQAVTAALLLPALALRWVQLRGGHADYQLSSVLVYWMNTALVLLLWTGLWAGLHGLRHARHSELARLRAEAERSALERDALRARLNPHFMFNALNNLRALILEDPERARDMATRLSRTLRHALAHNRSEQVTLAEELAVVDDYLAIEAIHFEQRLRVRRDIAVGAGQAQLPAMALQLLVENAIKHGIATRPGGGEVRIRATLDDGLLRLQVDNPIGTGSPETHGHGVGLAYLRAQLGTRGRFALQSVEERMQAIVEIPQ